MQHGSGIIEGFFGPEWSWGDRRMLADFLKSAGGDHYIYAPKRDPFLRKRWTEDHPSEVWQQLLDLSQVFKSRRLKFGVGLSPFELHDHWHDPGLQRRLKEKVEKLSGLGLDYLGLFFDDMKGNPDLARQQCDMVKFVQSFTQTQLLFCPTYYTPDPILDKVFGQRPPGYLEYLGENLDQRVSILWTGNKVIPSEIKSEDLLPVAAVLKRKPFIWDNFFANDGPRQCKFIRLKAFTGRSEPAFHAAAGWTINPMNQAAFSQTVCFAAFQVLNHGVGPEAALEEALRKFAGAQLAEVLLRCRPLFQDKGLDQMSEGEKSALKLELSAYSSEPLAKEALDWLNGKYLVGAECLTD